MTFPRPPFPPPWHRRRLIAWLGVAGLSLPAVAQPRLPAVNLLLSWEVVEGQAAAAGLSTGGGWAVSTQGMAGAQPGAVLRSAPTDRSAGVQRLRVVNGGQATARLGRPVQVVWAEGLRTPDGDVGVLRQAWTEAVTALTLRPVWPGGQAPVALSVSAVLPQGRETGEMASMARLGGPERRDRPPAHAQVETQLLLPMGEWVTLADLGPAPVHTAPGELSTRSVARRAGPVLRVKVEAQR
ncbi:hypothetical protein [Aquabacterium sp. J223]|uniref:hypothetical protein n=1 Tax=Aquabacterium sp. J223 TaxID=2898431 RepID=UPI0021AD71C8|nr:hypothetical protein [Aquabacterium sp. J223]UUX96345.1 hypothetical protein LRS07_03215 [Aquabacterium sp. J223]